MAPVKTGKLKDFVVFMDKEGELFCMEYKWDGADSRLVSQGYTIVARVADKSASDAIDYVNQILVV